MTAVECEDGSRRLVQVCSSFKPGMTHQVFEDEKIVGIPDPHVDIYFNPSTCDVWKSLSVLNRCVPSPSVVPHRKVIIVLYFFSRSQASPQEGEEVDCREREHQSLTLLESDL